MHLQEICLLCKAPIVFSQMIPFILVSKGGKRKILLCESGSEYVIVSSNPQADGEKKVLKWANL